MSKLYKILLTVLTVQVFTVSSGEASEKKCLALTRTDNVDIQLIEQNYASSVIAVTSVVAVEGKAQPTDEQFAAAAKDIADKMKKEDSAIAQKSDSHIKRQIAEAFVEVATGQLVGETAKVLSPFIDKVTEFTAGVEFSGKLMTMDFNIIKGMKLTPYINLRDFVLPLAGSMLLSSTAKGKLLSAAPPSSSDIARVQGMDYAQVYGESGIFLAGTIATPIIASYIAELACGYLGTDSQVVSIGVNLVVGTACTTAKKYMLPAAQQAYGDALQIYSEGKTKEVFNQACAKVTSGPTYLYSIGVWGLNELTTKVKSKLS